jgi:hypothetical protein
VNVTRTERGWPGHFIGGRECLFRRNTLLECGDRRVVVSTVGNYRPLSTPGKITEIGLKRYYETMAFEATFDEPYWETDAECAVPFDSPWMIDHCRREADAEANAMHEAVVAELIDRLGNQTQASEADQGE